MIIGTIKRDQKAAIAAEAPQRLTETGAYLGRIIQAEQYETQGGATMARLLFQEDAGSIAWLNLCLLKKDGEEARTMRIFQSVLDCAGVDTVTAIQGKARMPNGEVNDHAYRMRELEGKRLGLLLVTQAREYRDREGVLKIGTDLQIFRAFFADTQQTSKERSEGKPAARIAADLAYQKAHPRPVQKLSGGTAPAASAAFPAGAPPAPPDCPF